MLKAVLCLELSFPVEQPAGGLTELVRLGGDGSGGRRARRRGQRTGGDDIVSGVDGKSDIDNIHPVSRATIRNAYPTLKFSTLL